MTERASRLRTRVFAGNLRIQQGKHVLLAMQKVEGSNPFSRSFRSGSTEPQTASRWPCGRGPDLISGPGAHWVFSADSGLRLAVFSRSAEALDLLASWTASGGPAGGAEPGVHSVPKPP